MGEVKIRQGQEGSRWINERPSAEAIATWFRDSVSVPEGLDVANYVSGVTLIQSTEDAKEVIGFKDDGTPTWREISHIVYVPYVKVETRVQFFHDLMAQHREDWLGVIEPVSVPNPSPDLPPGFFKFTSADTPFICCTMKVTVFERSTVKWVETRNVQTGEMERVRVGKTIIDAPPATKMVPSKRKYADSSSIMKAETGAVGRALGMAGMLIVPGSGVATAEDVREAQDIEQMPSAAREEAPLPEGQRSLAIAEPSHEELVTRAVSLIQQLKDTSEDAHAIFLAWVKEKGYEGKVSEMPDPAIKGLIKKAEKDLEEAVGAAQEAEKG